MHPPLFRETQYAGMAWLILFAVGLVVPAGLLLLARFCAGRRDRRSAVFVLVPTALGMFAVCAAIALFYGVMTTEVTPTEIDVQFGWLSGHAEVIPIAEVHKVEGTHYDAMGEYRGWGIRGRGPNDRALTQTGDRGVRLYLGGEKMLLIGSQRPEELAQAIEKARGEQ